MHKNLSLREIRTFVAVVDEGGLALAAESLALTQPAVTMQVQRLEKTLGVDLFERRGKRLVLTQHGHRALPNARRLLLEAERFASIALNGADAYTATLVVGALEPTASTRIIPVLAKLKERAPLLEIKVTMLGGDNIARAAEAASIDVALTTPASITGWTFEPLFSERLFALVPRTHALASQSGVSIARLASERLVLTDETCVYRRTVERAFARHGARAKLSIETGSLMWLPQAVAGGLGIGIVPKTLPISMDAQLQLLPIRERVDLSIGVLRPNSLTRDSPVSMFLDAAESLRAGRRR